MTRNGRAAPCWPPLARDPRLPVRLLRSGGAALSGRALSRGAFRLLRGGLRRFRARGGFRRLRARGPLRRRLARRGPAGAAFAPDRIVETLPRGELHDGALGDVDLRAGLRIPALAGGAVLRAELPEAGD